LTLRILFRPQEERLAEILNNLGMEYDEKILPSIGNEVLKSIVAQYDAGQLITMREKVSQDIREQLQKRAVEFGLILEDISITDLHFSREFAASIEEKQVA
jgi:prohibitin 1